MSNNSTTMPAHSSGAREEGSFWSWSRVLAAVALLLVIVAVGTSFGMYAGWNNSGKIAKGIIVQGESLDGLTQGEAKARLEQRFGRLFVTLQTPQRPYKLALKQLGGTVKIDEAVQNAYWFGRSKNPLQNAVTYWTAQGKEQRRAIPVSWNKDTLRKTMWVVATQYKRAPRDAKLEVTKNGVQVIPDETGRAMNVGDTCKILQARYYPGKPEIKATVSQTPPRIAAADLVGRDVEMGSYTTTFNSGVVGRTKNIKLAVAAINGKVLMPGEKFSFNASTGERTRGKGYRIAHIFVRKPGEEKAEVVEGRGGGVCQVSSTLYNAVRKTNNKTDYQLKIIERNHHSLPVTYVPEGLDATVAWPSKDFRFRNTFSHPVYLRLNIVGSRLTIGVWGRVPDDLQSVTVDPSKHASADGDSPA